MRNSILNAKKARLGLGRYLRPLTAKVMRLAALISSRIAAIFTNIPIIALSTFAAAIFAGWQGWIANQTLIASNRPWVSIEPIIASDFIWADEGARITIKFKLKNIGHAPADIVSPITSAIYLFAPPYWDPAGRQKELCAPPKFPWRGGFGFTIFPDETDDSEANLEAIDRKDIDAAFHRNNGQIAEITPVLIGCVKYRYALDNLEHQTGFIRVLSWVNRAQPGRLSGFDPTKGTVPVDQIRFDKTLAAPGLAN